jgi:hypothetical protein
MWAVVARLLEDGSGQAGMNAPVSPSGPGGISLALVVAEIGRHTLATGLCFVPDLVLTLLGQGTLPQVHAALGAGVRAQAIALSPESGPGRLSPREAALCPEGFKGARLCWARSCAAG